MRVSKENADYGKLVIPGGPHRWPGTGSRLLSRGQKAGYPPRRSALPGMTSRHGGAALALQAGADTPFPQKAR